MMVLWKAQRREVRTYPNGVLVATATSERTAQQIVKEHNAIVDRLREERDNKMEGEEE